MEAEVLFYMFPRRTWALPVLVRGWERFGRGGGPDDTRKGPRLQGAFPGTEVGAGGRGVGDEE